MKESMYCLKDMLYSELDEICEKGQMSAEDLETVHLLTDTIKNIGKIETMEETGYSRDNGGSDYSNSHYVRGHYSRENRYSMTDGKSRIGERIRRMMDDEDLSQRDRERLKKVAEMF